MVKENEPKWVDIHTTTNEYEANIIKGLLESQGIHCLVKSFRVTQFPFDIGHLGEIKLLVPSIEAEKGKRVINRHLCNKNSPQNLE